MNAAEKQEIKAQRAALLKELRKAQADVKLAQAKLRALQDQCEHPNMRRYADMKDTGHYCSLCGWET